MRVHVLAVNACACATLYVRPGQHGLAVHIHAKGDWRLLLCEARKVLALLRQQLERFCGAEALVVGHVFVERALAFEAAQAAHAGVNCARHAQKRLGPLEPNVVAAVLVVGTEEPNDGLSRGQARHVFNVEVFAVELRVLARVRHVYAQDADGLRVPRLKFCCVLDVKRHLELVAILFENEGVHVRVVHRRARVARTHAGVVAVQRGEHGVNKAVVVVVVHIDTGVLARQRVRQRKVRAAQL